jgi:hypothetical protein
LVYHPQVDITFPGLPCAWMSLDAMDVSGEIELDVEHDISKRRLSATGVPLHEPEKHTVRAPVLFYGHPYIFVNPRSTT